MHKFSLAIRHSTFYRKLEGEHSINMVTDFSTETIRELLGNYITEELAYDRANLSITSDLKLVDQGVIDSMGILRLMTFIEENFSLTLAPEDLMLENFVTLDAVTAFVTRKLTAL